MTQKDISEMFVFIIVAVVFILIGFKTGIDSQAIECKTKTPLKPTFEITVDSTGRADTTFVYKLK